MRANEFTNFTYKTEPYEGWNGDGIVVRAYDGGTEVGHVIFEPTEDDNTQWYAVDVEVEEPYQRKGIATKMYDIAKKSAKQHAQRGRHPQQLPAIGPTFGERVAAP